jgi:hypothetical protein
VVPRRRKQRADVIKTVPFEGTTTSREAFTAKDPSATNPWNRNFRRVHSPPPPAASLPFEGVTMNQTQLRDWTQDVERPTTIQPEHVFRQPHEVPFVAVTTNQDVYKAPPPETKAAQPKRSEPTKDRSDFALGHESEYRTLYGIYNPEVLKGPQFGRKHVITGMSEG